MYMYVNLSFVIQEFYLGKNVTEENCNYCSELLPTCCNARRLSILAHRIATMTALGFQLTSGVRSGKKMTSTGRLCKAETLIMHSEMINTNSRPGNMNTFSTWKEHTKALSTGIFLQDLLYNIVSNI